jgi:hypothetical protein
MKERLFPSREAAALEIPRVGFGVSVSDSYCNGGVMIHRDIRYIDKRKLVVIIKSEAILASGPIYLLTK